MHKMREGTTMFWEWNFNYCLLTVMRCYFSHSHSQHSTHSPTCLSIFFVVLVVGCFVSLCPYLSFRWWALFIFARRTHAYFCFVVFVLFIFLRETWVSFHTVELLWIWIYLECDWLRDDLKSFECVIHTKILPSFFCSLSHWFHIQHPTHLWFITASSLYNSYSCIPLQSTFKYFIFIVLKVENVFDLLESNS